MKYGDKIVPNPDRIDLHEAYMQMAEIWARRSKSNRTQVGALIVKDKCLISDGYNGMPASTPPDEDVCEEWIPNTEHLCDDTNSFHKDQMVTKPETLHAESNAILKIAKYGGRGTEGADLYVTLSPCKICANLIVQSGIKRVFYRDSYRDTGGIDTLVKANVEVVKLEHEDRTKHN